jgi:hypothetical protein
VALLRWQQLQQALPQWQRSRRWWGVTNTTISTATTTTLGPQLLPSRSVWNLDRLSLLSVAASAVPLAGAATYAVVLVLCAQLYL